MEKADRKGDRQFFLEAWGGTGQFNVDRIGRGSTHVDALCVSVLGGIQPGPLKPYIRQVLQNGRDADGFMPRFQMLVWPDSPTEWRNVDRLPDYQAKEIVWRLFETIGSLQVDEIVQAIRFDEAAQEVFNVWLHQLESELRSGEHPNYFISHLAKYRSLMPSLALICHCADHMDTYTLPESKVPIACAEQAAAWCDYLKAHARRIYAETVPRSDLESAHALAQKIKSGEIRNRMTLRNIERAKWSKLTTPELVRDGLSVLQEQGWVIVEKRETGGRPSEIINLHPDFHCQN
jgi:putative DNA primase/helicase